jgi:hypothetical protein
MGLKDSIPTLRAVVETYSFMDVRLVNGAKRKKKGSSPELPKD